MTIIQLRRSAFGSKSRTTRASLEKLLNELPENRLRALLQYGEFLRWQGEREDWRRFGQAQFAKVYGPYEPDYSAADLLPERNP